MDTCKVEQEDQAPVVIGGLGGSGTRLVTRVLQREGVVFAGELNDSLDNLWFTLLFVRRSILLKSADKVDGLAWLFANAMRQGESVPDSLLPLLTEAAQHDRGPALRRDVLASALKSIQASDAPAKDARRWGWKQPNSHVMVPLLLSCFPSMKYIYVVRNGLDMALSYNQNQLMYFWGDIMLDGDCSPSPRNALKYWVESYRRMQADAVRFPGRIYILDYDRLCRDPAAQMTPLNRFLELEPLPGVLEEVAGMVSVPGTTGRHRNVDLSQFCQEDLAFAREKGLDMGA